MEKKRLETLESYQLDWLDVLSDSYDFEEEGKILFPHNPPDPVRCKKMMDHFCRAYCLMDTKSVSGTILIRDHGLRDRDLPYVAVVKEEKNGKISEVDLSYFSLEQLVSMPIEVRSRNHRSRGQIATLILFNLIYPLRVKRQIKRESIALFLNVLCQNMEKQA